MTKAIARTSVVGAVFFTLSYWLYSFAFSYVTITEGWFSHAAMRMIGGELPYRDFYLFMPPVYPAFLALISKFFSSNFFHLRLLGCTFVLGISFCLYKIFKTISCSWIGVFSSISLTIFYCGNNAFITYDFMQVMTFLCLLGIVVLLYALNFPSRYALYIAAAGACFGTAFLVKQSNPSLIIIFTFLPLGLIAINERKPLIIVSFLTGLSIPLILCIAWLTYHSLLPEFLSQVFLDAGSSKGGIRQVLTAWIATFRPPFNIFVRHLAIFFICLGYPLSRFSKLIFRGGLVLNQKTDAILVVISGLTIAILIFLTKNQLLYEEILTTGLWMNNYVSVASIISMIACIVFSSTTYIKYKTNHDLLLISFAGFGFLYGSGTSAGIGDAGIFFGLGLCLTLLLRLRSILFIGQIVTISVATILIAFYVDRKLERPYHWWGTECASTFKSTIRLENLGVLTGLYTDSTTSEAIKNLLQEIKTLNPTTLISFPHAPLFNLLSHTSSGSKALVYWYDFFPNRLATDELKQLTQLPPEIVVYVHLPDSALEAHERLFNQSKPLKIRKIKQFFEDTTKYSVSKSFLINGSKVDILTYRK